MKAGQSKNAALDAILVPGEGWQLFSEGYRFTEGPAANERGEVFFNDIPNSKTYKVGPVYSYQVQPDGSLLSKQRYYWLHEPDAADESGADGMRAARDGRLYVATRLGIQVCDQAGRVNCIIPTPNGIVSNVCFGGESFDTLFATCGDKVYKRKMKVRGANAWAEPHKPAPPRL